MIHQQQQQQQAISCSRHGRRGRRVRHVRLGSLLRLRLRLFGLVGTLIRCLEEFGCCPRRRWSPATAPATAQHQKLSHAATSRCRRPAAVPAERESSFHAEAIADCLEFIKRSYLPVHDDDHRAS